MHFIYNVFKKRLHPPTYNPGWDAQGRGSPHRSQVEALTAPAPPKISSLKRLTSPVLQVNSVQAG